MLDLEKISEKNSILVLNKPQILTRNDFYIQLFKVPEVLSRLRQYRELLFQNNINIPIWVYCLTQDITTLRGTPQTEVAHFLVSMGLYDRYISKMGWPDYILGPSLLISVLSDSRSFEDEILNLTNDHQIHQQNLSLIKIKSYYDNKTKKFCLTNLKNKMNSCSFKSILEYVDQDLNKDQKMGNQIYRFLCPHENSLEDYMKSIGVSTRDFLEYDEDLKWLWPLWKRTQLFDGHSEKLA